jgi:hypothetical protein
MTIIKRTRIGEEVEKLEQWILVDGEYQWCSY